MLLVVIEGNGDGGRALHVDSVCKPTLLDLKLKTAYSTGPLYTSHSSFITHTYHGRKRWKGDPVFLPPGRP